MRTQSRTLVDALLEARKPACSGVVRLDRGKTRKQIVLHSGEVAFAESNLPDEHLARVLLQMGRLQKPDLAKIAAAMKQGQASDEAVRQVTHLAPSTIEEGLREQAVMIAASLLPQEGAEFRFYSIDGPLHRSCNLHLKVPELLVLAARRAVGRRQVPGRYRDLRGILHPLPRGEDDRLGLPLDTAEAYAFSALREPATLETFAARLPALAVSPEELAQRLLLLGLFRLETPAAQSAGLSQGCADESVEQDVQEYLERCERANHYEVLALTPDATAEQIRLAYHDLARQFHPDRFQSTEHGNELRQSVERLFTFITGAYSVLGNPDERAKYDAELKEKQTSSQGKLDTRAGSGVEKEKMAETLFRAGRAAFAQGEVDKAAGLLRECVWLQPDVAKYQYHLGLAQTDIPKQRKEAEKSLLAAIRLEPTLVDAHVALARLYIAVRLPRRAEAQLDVLLRWDPTNREACELMKDLVGQSRSRS